MKRKFMPFVAAILVMALAGCSLPGISTPTPFVFPSPTSKLVPADQPVATATLPPVLTSTLPPVPSSTPLPPDTATPTIIPTSTRTSTPVPTNTPTEIPRVGSAASVMKPAPTIDGVWDEWKSTQYPITDVVWGRSNWTGKADLQASYRVAWDSKYLYVAVKVFDDKYEQNSSGANLYLGDSLELLFSTNPNADSPNLGLTSSDYQLGISPGKGDIGKDMEAYLWFPKGKAGKLSSVAMAAVPMDGGYRIEFAIPWSVFNITPAKGQVYGFAVSVSDNDNSKNAEQQSMISSVPHRNLVDPTSWGLLTLK